MKRVSPVGPILALVLLAFLVGCRSLSAPPPTTEPEPEPATPVTEPEDGPPPPSPPISEQLVQDADEALEGGDALTAAYLLDEALGQPGIDRERRAELRLRLAMLYVDPTSQIHNPVRGAEELERVVGEDPGSIAARHAGAVQALIAAAQQEAEGRQDAEGRAETQSQRVRTMERELGTCKREVERIKQILLQEGAEEPG